MQLLEPRLGRSRSGDFRRQCTTGLHITSMNHCQSADFFPQASASVCPCKGTVCRSLFHPNVMTILDYDIISVFRSHDGPSHQARLPQPTQQLSFGKLHHPTRNQRATATNLRLDMLTPPRSCPTPHHKAAASTSCSMPSLSGCVPSSMTACSRSSAMPSS